MTNTATNTIHRNVVPSEVGWQFVPQYYTFVNKQPDRLHCFYTKKSTFIHGTEGEDGKACHGQQEIHQKITSLGFNDCKVFIHSVDAQSSADGGIIIQVIGEMSNQGEDWRKFVQTFFLAEQPNGYFVLNDIFRFLKEETVESEDVEPEQSLPSPVPEPVSAPVAVVEIPREPTPAPPTPSPPPVVAAEELPTTVADIPPSPVAEAAPVPPSIPVSISSSRPNGIHTQEQDARASPAPTEPVAPAEKAKSPPPSVGTPAAAATPPPEPAPPAQPAAPKTWANLAAANSKKWGSAVAQESRGTSQVVPPSPVPSIPQTPMASTPSSTQGSGPRPLPLSVQAITTPQCFIKGVTEPVTQAALSSYLTQRFGPIKDIDIVRSKACAFAEFISLDAARRAIATCLPVAQGGEGGIWINTPEVGQVRLVVETRKERADRPVSRPRGGGPPVVPDSPSRGGANTGGGSFRGRGGPNSRGRGGGGGK